MRNPLAFINSCITKAESVKDILAVVRDNVRELNHIHVGAAFNRMGRMAKSSPEDFVTLLTADDAFQALLRLAKGFADDGQFDARNLSNATHGVAKLHEAGRLKAGRDGSVDDALAALETAAARMAPGMNSHDLANIAYAYATLGRMPGEETWAAIETAVARTAPSMESQHLANSAWAYAKLGKVPGEETWAALDAAAVRLAPTMTAQNSANAAWAFAKLGRTPGEKTLAAQEAAARRVAPGMVGWCRLN